MAAVLAVGLIPGVPVYADTPTSWSGAYIGGHVGAAWREYSWHNARPFAGGTDFDFNSAASIAISPWGTRRFPGQASSKSVTWLGLGPM